MSNVAVLGGAGFVGSHLCEKLVLAGDNVTLIDNYERGQNEVEGVYPLAGDVTTALELSLALRGHDTVYNLAASVGGIYHNIDNQNPQLYQNFILQTTPLMAAEMVGVQRFLQVSSVCIYDPEYQESYENGVPEEIGLKGIPQEANAGYAWAKRMGEIATLQSKIPHVVIVRPSNIGGPRDYFDEKAHVIPALVRRAFQTRSGPGTTGSESLEVYGNPDYIREFIHVEDVAVGMVAAMELGVSGRTYNLGSGQLITIRDLAIKIARGVWATRTNSEHLMDGWIGEIDFVGAEGGDPYRKSNSTRANDELGWKAEHDIDKIVEDTIQWYRQSQL